ncbi:MAG: GTPase ObgE [Clostridiales bacterium]|jgi:GTP-binding protein|nr:GTPase ObgE [Clostridiales bacterium]
MFIDKAKITIKSGKGGDGAVSFYRGKYVPNGGPDGGDGGDGGGVIFVADRNVATLMDFRYKKAYEAQAGEDGGKKNCSGKKGADITIRVPVGTVIREEQSGLVMADMNQDGMQKTLAKGGRGGRGNQHFATAVRQAPRYAEKGRDAETYNVTLDLKLIADAGLVGLPNAGKSTLLSMVTNASPKIANYHFTTLTPNLGVVRNRYGNEFVMADIPGLIEGASQGAGLGHEFLGHVERTKILVHIVDASASEGGDPLDFIDTVNAELAAYSPELGKKPQIIAANKMDIPGAAEHFERMKDKWQERGVVVMPISAAAGTGLQELLAEAWKMVSSASETITYEEEYDKTAILDGLKTEHTPFTVKSPKPGYFLVEGVGVEKMVGYTNMDAEAGMAFFQKYLRDKGIIDELERIGVRDGDTVKIYDMEFDYFK